MVKKRHTIKTQVIIRNSSKEIFKVNISNGKKHDFKLFKEAIKGINKSKKVIADTGYQGLEKIHKNSKTPEKERRIYL